VVVQNRPGFVGHITVTHTKAFFRLGRGHVIVIVSGHEELLGEPSGDAARLRLGFGLRGGGETTGASLTFDRLAQIDCASLGPRPQQLAVHVIQDVRVHALHLGGRIPAQLPSEHTTRSERERMDDREAKRGYGRVGVWACGCVGV
jgi:hypothetical protein